MNEIEEATIGNVQAAQLNERGPAPAAQPPELTTDDLVFMIGEKAVTEKHNGKVMAWLQSVNQALQTEVQTRTQTAQAEISRLLGRIETLESENASMIDSGKRNAQSGDSLRQRVIELEKQVYQVALERDAAVKDLAAAKTVKKTGKRE